MTYDDLSGDLCLYKPFVKDIQLPFHQPVGLPTGVGVREAGAARFAGGVTSEAADAAGDAAAGPGFMGVTGGATGSAVEGGATGSGVGSPACSSFDSAED